jgi:phytoene dehydrogenase-like protein
VEELMDGFAGLLRPIVIIGAGHNGLVAAFYLARKGFPVVVLERRAIAGGTAVVEEIHPGFRCPTVLHSNGPLHPQVARDVGLRMTPRSGIRVLAIGPHGSALRIYNTPEQTAAELAAMSRRDGERYLQFHSTFERLGRFIAPLLSGAPPDIDHPSFSDYMNLGKAGLRFRGLERRDAYRLLRWGPMCVADLSAEWFETELLRATIEARGIFGTFAGPRSAGTSVGLLMQAAVDGHATPALSFLHTEDLIKAASAAGSQIQTNARVTSIRVKENRAIGVILETGEEIAASAVVSSVDPKQTFLNLVQPGDLDPGFLAKISSYRAHGTVAKVNLALSRLPSFNGIKNAGEDLSGHIHIGSGTDYLERAFDAAKYGDFSAQPYLDIAIPSLTDPTLAPKGAHVMSIHVQYAPYQLKTGDWSSRRDELADTVVRTLTDYAPDIRETIVSRQILTPVDLEQTYGLTGGHIFHGEHALDQLFTFRPLLGWARYRTPIKHLYICGTGTHPGGGMTGLSGANASREILRELK